MWKGSSEVLELTDDLDFGRTDLFTTFARDPLARHDLELQMFVSGLRGSARIPRFVLARAGEGHGHGRWLVIRVSPERGGQAAVETPRVFDDLRDAERYVFERRLELLGALDAAATDDGEDNR
jgi:hypothetical protein